MTRQAIRCVHGPQTRSITGRLVLEASPVTLVRLDRELSMEAAAEKCGPRQSDRRVDDCLVPTLPAVLIIA
jgi:hypothetical protein